MPSSDSNSFTHVRKSRRLGYDNAGNSSDGDNGSGGVGGGGGRGPGRVVVVGESWEKGGDGKRLWWWW